MRMLASTSSGNLKTMHSWDFQQDAVEIVSRVYYTCLFLATDQCCAYFRFIVSCGIDVSWTSGSNRPFPYVISGLRCDFTHHKLWSVIRELVASIPYIPAKNNIMPGPAYLGWVSGLWPA